MGFQTDTTGWDSKRRWIPSHSWQSLPWQPGPQSHWATWRGDWWEGWDRSDASAPCCWSSHWSAAWFPWRSPGDWSPPVQRSKWRCRETFSSLIHLFQYALYTHPSLLPNPNNQALTFGFQWLGIGDKKMSLGNLNHTHKSRKIEKQWITFHCAHTWNLQLSNEDG